MTLSSPNYPKWYNADGVGCEWLITAPEGFIIALEFNHFHVSSLQYFVKMITTIFNIYFSCISYMRAFLGKSPIHFKQTFEAK